MRAEPAVAVLGPVSATLRDRVVALGTPRQRGVLTALALRAGVPVPPGTLAESVWGRHRPSTWENTLQGYVAGLRRALEPGRRPRAPADVVVLEAGGYALRAVALDVDLFERGIDAVRREVGAEHDDTGLLPRVTGRAGEALLDRLDQVLALWRGTPFAELVDVAEAATARTRLEELRLQALEDRGALEIRLGRGGRAAADLEALTRTHPFRERLWALRALALARSGRQADALAVLAEVRVLLAEELGVDPGPDLVELHQAVLRQDPVLTPRPGRPRPSGVVGATPLVGRDVELGRLTMLHDEVVAAPGPPRFAVITGYPGIGKSRLVDDVAAHADRAGTRVWAARCPSDEGAPPLWAWSRLLGAAGAPMPATTVSDDGSSRFRAWGESVDALLDVVGDRPALVVLDDLQWADPSTLRVLALLAESERVARLAVVLTWRDEPLGDDLAHLSASVARRHALRVPLGGIRPSAAAALVAGAGGGELSSAEAEAWTRRTGGNPFFLVELAQLRREHPSRTEDLDVVPAGVREVVRQRLAALPVEVVRVLEVAAVLGQDVDVATLAVVASRDEADVVDDLERAAAAGVVHEVDVDRFGFVHELLRDAARAAVTRTRSVRLHAEAARVLARDAGPGREADIARHWLSAGPAHAAQAWRAAREAAAAARRLHGHDECAARLREALGALTRDAEARDEDRCDLLIELADALRLAGRWVEVRPVVHAALEVADRLGDVERAVAAATTPTEGALWLASPYNEVDDVVVSALRRVSTALPRGDDPWRCRVMLSLASEIYYAASTAERDALVDEAVAMAGRLGDDRLLLAAYLGGSRSIWRSSRSREQHRLATAAVDLAGRLGDDVALTDALTARAAVNSDLGAVDDLFDDLARARATAREHRMLFDAVVVDGIEIAWRILRGDTAEADRLTADVARALGQMDVAQLDDTPVATEIVRLLWSGGDEALLALLLEHDGDLRVPIRSFTAALLGRTGRLAEARTYLATHDLRLDVDDWLSPAIWSMAAEAAMHTQDREVAATVYERLAPLAGRPATAGPSVVVGPVDMALAMAARTVGEHDTARRHADDAEEVAASWRAEPVRRWVRAVRASWEPTAQA